MMSGDTVASKSGTWRCDIYLLLASLRPIIRMLWKPARAGPVKTWGCATCCGVKEAHDTIQAKTHFHGVDTSGYDGSWLSDWSPQGELYAPTTNNDTAKCEWTFVVHCGCASGEACMASNAPHQDLLALTSISKLWLNIVPGHAQQE